MDIAILDTNFIKIRGKRACFVVDPETSKSKAKIAADAIILLKDPNDSDFSNIENYRVVIKRPGEYEVNGIMIAGRQTDGGIGYKIIVDGVNIVLGKTSDIAKILDKIDSCQLLILNADSEINQAIVSSLEPNIVILYGEKSIEGVKMDKKNSLPVQKYSLTKEKLPEEMEVVVFSV